MNTRDIPENPKRESIISNDGSSTLWAPDFDEHYHSIHGALTESRHVFLQAGLAERLKKPLEELHIFEMGFGTGLNALLTCLYPERPTVYYTSIEKYPIGKDQWESLNYGKLLEGEESQLIFEHMHRSPWESWVKLTDDFMLKKQKGDLLAYQPANSFDLIYFDAFAPSSQANLWTEAVMAQVFSWCNEGAIFTTYSAKGDVRRALLAAGFEVEKIPGPPGKREMLRASKRGL